MVGSCMGEISTGAQSVARTPMYALAGNCRFCPADPMKKAPTAVLNPLHHCWGPNWHKTTLKKDSMVPHVGTLADDLSCPVQPPSLVQYLQYEYVVLPGRTVCPQSSHNGIRTVLIRTVLILVVRQFTVTVRYGTCNPYCRSCHRRHSRRDSRPMTTSLGAGPAVDDENPT